MNYCVMNLLFCDRLRSALSGVTAMPTMQDWVDNPDPKKKPSSRLYATKKTKTKPENILESTTTRGKVEPTE